MGANKLFLDLSRRARLIAFLVALIFSQKEALALEDFLMAVPSKTICSAYLFIGKDQEREGSCHHDVYMSCQGHPLNLPCLVNSVVVLGASFLARCCQVSQLVQVV